ncbi:MAG: hypothetical protein ACK5AZ_24225, partial [Bryobacteraceae bacterium]
DGESRIAGLSHIFIPRCGSPPWGIHHAKTYLNPALWLGFGYRFDNRLRMNGSTFGIHPAPGRGSYYGRVAVSLARLKGHKLGERQTPGGAQIGVEFETGTGGIPEASGSSSDRTSIL